MEKSRFKPETQTHPNLSPSSSGRRSNDPNSPEFEFWMVRNPSFPQPLLSADELFVDGVLLPLCLLSHHTDPLDSHPKSNPETPIPEPEPEPGPGPESSTVSSTSKRWRHIFKMGEKKTAATTTSNPEDKDREKKKERKSNSGATAAAELNIHIWPFSRSRSAGNNGNRPKIAVGGATRKVSSAPCSRSNSAGESKSKKWPSSPGRTGFHLGRSSPVWQVRRGGSGVRNSEPVVRNAGKGLRKEGLENRRNKNLGSSSGARVRVLNLNVPMCIGYRQHLNCRNDENSTVSNGNADNGGSGGNLFNLRTLFSKKMY